MKKTKNPQKQSSGANLEMTQTLQLANKDFRVGIINMFKHLKETHAQRLTQMDLKDTKNTKNTNGHYSVGNYNIKKRICWIDNSRSGMTQLESEPDGRVTQIIQSEKQRE